MGGILARRKFSVSSTKSGILLARNNFSDFMISDFEKLFKRNGMNC
jgi:hypothetical protein